jgi:hypothetical protein
MPFVLYFEKRTTLSWRSSSADDEGGQGTVMMVSLLEAQVLDGNGSPVLREEVNVNG